MSRLETAEEFHARVVEATEDGRLAVAVEEMPGWDIYPYEIDSLRIKPLQPLADEEPPRWGEDPATCRCASGEWPGEPDTLVWHNDRWRLKIGGNRLPASLWLEPRAHCDLGDVPADLAAEMGRLIVAVVAAVESLPSVGRAQLARYGDGGAHLHLLFTGRPARALQFRGSPLIDWEENLPEVPADVLRANAEAVAASLVATVGGTAFAPA